MRRYRKTLSLLSAISLLLFAMCGKDEETGPVTGAPGQEKHIAIITTANTALRVDPLISTSRIAQMKKGEITEVIERSAVVQSIAGQKDYWYKVRLSNGITGWVFGKNISILSDSSSDNIESYLSSFWEKETDELSEALHGKWWSVNRFGDYTNHCLEIYKDGRYASYIKGATKKIEGNYNFDFNKSRIIFLAGTSFEGELNYVRRGDIFSLYRDTVNDEIRFKKINNNPESQSEVSEDQVTGGKPDAAEDLKKTDEN
ncbi:MAG TPA: SH3 domain-containing protein [Spirochaetota bacterium]|nr:SH3 domain-containing protein [Spirochaetota bacterium]